MRSDQDWPLRNDAVEELRARVGELDQLPLPGQGDTAARWRALAAIGREDLSAVRLAEGHADARAILCELGRVDLVDDGRALGVWAAEPDKLTATPTGQGWRLDGCKRWCSGSTGLDRALVTAAGQDGPRLFLVDAPDLEPQPGSWRPMGMVETRSDAISFTGHLVPHDRAIGGPNAYVQRPGFGHGGCGVAACWWGGALGVLDGLHRSVAAGCADDAASALGLSAAVLASAGHTLRAAADAIDGRPGDADLAVLLAGEVRLTVASCARTVVDRTIEALGAAGLCQQPDHSTRVADLLVYLSQHRAQPASVAHARRIADAPLVVSW